MMLLGMRLREAEAYLRQEGKRFRTTEYVDRKTDMNGEARVVRVTGDGTDEELLLVYTYTKKDVNSGGRLY